jgi:hypothetical protein
MVRGPTELKGEPQPANWRIFCLSSPYIGIFLADFPAFFWRLATLTHFMGVATLYVATLTRSNFDPVATLTRSNFDP